MASLVSGARPWVTNQNRKVAFVLIAHAKKRKANTLDNEGFDTSISASPKRPRTSCVVSKHRAVSFDSPKRPTFHRTLDQGARIWPFMAVDLQGTISGFVLQPTVAKRSPFDIHVDNPEQRSASCFQNSTSVLDIPSEDKGSLQKDASPFDIHVDTPEQASATCFQHSMGILDISSEEDKATRHRAEDFDKENTPPGDDVSQASVPRTAGLDNIVDEARVALRDVTSQPPMLDCGEICVMIAHGHGERWRRSARLQNGFSPVDFSYSAGSLSLVRLGASHGCGWSSSHFGWYVNCSPTVIGVPALKGIVEGLLARKASRRSCGPYRSPNNPPRFA